VEAVRPWILGALSLSLGLGVIGGAGLLIRVSQLVQGSPVPEGEPTPRECLTVRYGADRRPSATVSATVTASRPYGVKFSPCV